MRKLILLLFLPALSFSQSIQVDQDRYTAQELIEELLIQSDCITDVVVTNVYGANFTDGSKSFGYFDAAGTGFPISNGLVLSTGKLETISEPTSSLANDFHSGWDGDAQLEAELGIDSYNATIIEFDFVPNVAGISFRYLFASEEYQFDNSVTCKFSDAFGFFIRKADETSYKNLAVVPGTQTPILNTTVHPFISENCPAVNEAYFDRFNFNAETIFDGQTKVLNAVAEVIPGETYHVKLVIADDLNDKYDSAVFLEAGSFQSSADLGPDRLVQNNDALCYGEVLVLEPATAAGDQVAWYRNGNFLPGETNSQLRINKPGEYAVQITSSEGCIAQGNIIVEYYPQIDYNSAVLEACGFSTTETAQYNLHDSASQILNPNQRTTIEEFFMSRTDAENAVNPIADPEYFISEARTVFGTVHDGFGCSEIAEITLTINAEISLTPFEICSVEESNDPEIALTDLTAHLIDQNTNASNFQIYSSAEHALNDEFEIVTNFSFSELSQDKLYVKLLEDNNCLGFAIVPVQLLGAIELPDDIELSICSDSKDLLLLESGLDSSLYEEALFQWFYEGEPIPQSGSSIYVSEPGNYKVEVSHQNACTASRNFEINPVETAVIREVNITNLGNEIRVEIEVTGNSSYEYALDDSSQFQQISVFSDVSPGNHVLFVRDTEGCQTVSREISIFGYDPFFTPNGDGYNDSWTVHGLTSDYYIQIYSRYGKLYTILDSKNSSWNGKFENNDLPAGEYWFSLIQGGKVNLTGHFSLIR
ncbi:T9SS type B sorting domain-containing protein [Christiangramia portivictoriae]|uniref:T9SS type B sorting domain-containing protein n=1 Tax=Christiangramia portivictoriae TaxID=326069 RepID=UPI000406A6E6|nr:choice-of-anchor L domain-containing protein [Christiangramia portivictoriae]